MIQWKQRLYAFLLRRLLGPILDESGTQQLHDSLDISLHEGKFVLKDVSLNAQHLTELMSANVPGLKLRRARIDRLEINLTLRENSPEGSDTNSSLPQSSLAWRAMQLGTLDSTIPAVSLVADIAIDGIYLDLEHQPGMAPPRPSAEPELHTDEEGPTTRSTLGSYMDAALASLKLTPKIKNLNVRLCAANPTKESEAWVHIRLASASYRDVDDIPPTKPGNLHSRTVMNKIIEFTGVSIQTGEIRTNDFKDGEASREALMRNQASTVALAQGTTQVCFRAIEYENTGSTINMTDSSTPLQRLQHDIEVRLAQQLNLSADRVSLLQIMQVLESFSGVSMTGDSDAPIVEEKTESQPQQKSAETNDEEDLRVLTGIMKQYQEAYHLAERNELRGGILIPSNAYEEGVTIEDDEAVTFDVFFDANDKSFYNYASMVQESMAASDSVRGLSSFGHTKLRVQLMSGCFKLILGDPKRNLYSRMPEEYILISFDDLNYSSSTSEQTSEHSITISHFEIDDAQFCATKSNGGYITMGVTHVPEGRVDIGSVLRFNQGSADLNDSTDDAVVSPAPCISVQLVSKFDGNSCKVVECDIGLAPVEFVYRHHTLSNLSSFLQNKWVEGDISGNVGAKSSKAGVNGRVCLSCSCPGMTFSIPVLRDVETKQLFSRCGVVLENEPAQHSALGISLNDISICYNNAEKSVESDGPSATTASFSCSHFLVFASSPAGNGIGISTRLLRTDIAVGRGRMEVEPYIPVSVDCRIGQSDNPDENYGRSSFPVVPLISSFKARQEDEDEEVKIDKVLSSKLQSVDADSRRELRGSDPQSSMISDAEQCSIVICVGIPEIVVDVSAHELEVVSKMVHACLPASKVETDNASTRKVDDIEKLCFAITCDSVSFLLHQDVCPGSEWQYSFFLMMDRLKTHALLVGPNLKHFRLLCHEAAFYEVCKRSAMSGMRPAFQATQSRMSYVRERGFRGEISSVSHILYRSHLFTPISRESPSLLLDCTDLASERSGGEAFMQKKLQVTLYHLTYRYDIDSTWLDRLAGIFGEKKVKSNQTDITSEEKRETEIGEGATSPSLTRLFVVLADCNLDYTSAPYFKDASRTIVRIGDLRISSNIMQPSGPAQAFSISLGDISLHLCNKRYPYNAEHSKVFGASSLRMTHQQLEMGYSMSTPETLLREMGFVNVVTLDSMDAIIAIHNFCKGGSKRSVQEPLITSSLTFGLLSVHACKDSLALLAATVGEIQAKLTALTDDDILKMKLKPCQVSAENGEGQQTLIGDQGGKGIEIPRETSGQISPDDNGVGPIIDVEILRSKCDHNEPFLLDGYDWTTVDQDSQREPDIPDGEEQVALWYNMESSNGEDSGVHTYPGRIIHQHFPLHTVSDPLSEGDMGAATFADNVDPQVKSRLLVHDLTIKLRFFDGYDWPESLSLAERKARRDPSSFIIEPLPPEILQQSFDDNLNTPSATGNNRHDELMGNLLGASTSHSKTFDNMPLPEERGAQLQRQAELLRLSRKTHRFFQLAANGLTLRMDSYEASPAHRLVSTMDISISDLFLAECISRTNPIKMFGEWVNEKEHPRDTRHGTLMLKMVTWHPSHCLTSDEGIANDECEVTLQLLPMRCVIDQTAISFARAFFASGDDKKEDASDWTTGLHLIPPPKFRVFRVKPWRLKVDYYPKKLDMNALREGSVVELINLSPLDQMVITLKQVNVEGVIGMGEVFSGLASRWINDVASTQLHKFITSARPFEPFANIGGGLSDMVVLPYEAFRNGEDIRRAMRSGFSSLAGTVAFEALTTTSKLTQYAASKMAEAVGGTHAQRSTGYIAASPLPSRPLETPKGVSDVTGHAFESLTRGFQAANYKVVVVPYRELKRSGTTGAVKSVLKGIPVLIVAPLTGATEAISYTLLGARNALRPDIRKEEEASLLGLH